MIKVKKDRHGRGKRHRVRYLDPNGDEKSASFDKKGPAERFKIRVEADDSASSADGPVTAREVSE